MDPQQVSRRRPKEGMKPNIFLISQGFPGALKNHLSVALHSSAIDGVQRHP